MTEHNAQGMVAADSGGKATMTQVLAESEIAGLKRTARGKVRDIYDLGDRLLLVATDRISAFDVILTPPIPGKGRLLTQISAFWFKLLGGTIPNHLISADLSEIAPQLPPGISLDPEHYDGRVMLVKKARRVDAECVVRGYLAGSGWKEYQANRSVCGHALPAGLRQAEKLPTPIFTPATKADSGHDENISREALAELVGSDLAKRLEELSIKIYNTGAAYMAERGIILADTKFEFGFIDGELCVIDEMLTPDSSRFWEKSEYRPGTSPGSFDKQFVRDHLETIGWDKEPPAPVLPPDVIAGTTARYEEALRRLAA